MKKPAPKVVENRLRDTLKRRGLRLEKSRRRDPQALTYARYWIIGARMPLTPNQFLIAVIEGDSHRAYTMTLDQVDALCRKSFRVTLEQYNAEKMACMLAMEAYTTDRGKNGRG
jgi:hypothetical protein